MEFEDLKRIVTSFADDQADVISGKGELLATIRGESIEIKVSKKDGDLIVHERGNTEKAIFWVMNRVAALHQLADRIIDYIPSQDPFVLPTGKLLDDIEIDPTETERPVDDALLALFNKLNNPIPNASNVIYLTSDAGDGKTTIINELARKQAERFKKKEASWLLVPIPLGGRPFLRFDDIVIASLVNRLRFRLFYYDSFLELIKLGLIVPAFDGFEEMFMESSSGEALSATGSLMSKLNSKGAVLIAARKAYFDYKNFNSQARLFDSIGNNSVSFSKVSISRWSKYQFLEYAYAKGVSDAEEIYEFIHKKFQNDSHPLITRPVLVNQLLEVIKTSSDIQVLSESLQSTSHYFPLFVDAIIKREAETKWIDRTGEPFKPILTNHQHYQLLAVIAEEMWLNNTDSLQESVFDLIADMYSESNKFSATISKQIKERLKQHALIIKADSHNQFKFDHDEFREFFLGIAIVEKFLAGKILEIKNLMRRGLIHTQTNDTISIKLKENKEAILTYLQMIQEMQAGEGPTSFIRENNGQLAIRLVNGESFENLTIENCVFPSNSLHGVTLNSISIKSCHFQATSIAGSSLYNCIFENCTFDKLEYRMGKSTIENSSIHDCQVTCLHDENTDYDYYSPGDIEKKLVSLNFNVSFSAKMDQDDKKTDSNVEDLEIIDRALRKFMRSTTISDNILKMRLGPKADHFFRNLYPLLERNGILMESTHSGAGKKQVFRLRIPFDKLNYALVKSEGDMQRFILLCKT